MIRIAAIVVGLFALFGTGHARAHEMRPAYLSMVETAPQRFDVVWKVPARGEAKLALFARLPESCTPEDDPLRSIDGAAYLERWTAFCAEGLKGQRIGIDGLTATLTDVLVRITYADGAVEVARLTPDAPEFIAKGAQTGFEVLQTYFRLGVDHILSGFDHLLFVLCLILLIGSPWMLLKAITAFTLAHSITLAGATLGFLSLPQAPVEAVIALSIAFLAAELVRERRDSLRRAPWVAAFAFGLLHGFGFAGALSETGLPQSDVPLALVGFNLGVEAGQLLFVAVVLAARWALGRILTRPVPRIQAVSGYLIGTLAMIWFFDRAYGFLA
jgi:hydrogenase/urease accessory protein HupE